MRSERDRMLEARFKRIDFLIWTNVIGIIILIIVANMFKVA